MIDREGAQSQLSILRFLSFVFLLRAPSGGLRMRRSVCDTDLTSRTPLEFQSALGIVEEEIPPKLILKLRKRKNVKPGMVLIRPWLCGEGVGGRNRSTGLLHRASILAHHDPVRPPMRIHFPQ